MGNGSFLPLDVLRNGNAGRLDDVDDVDVNAWPDVAGFGHQLSVDVAGNDGGHDAAVCVAHVFENKGCASLIVGNDFAVWVVAGVGVYALGVAFAAAATRWETFSRAVPLLSGASLIPSERFSLRPGK